MTHTIDNFSTGIKVLLEVFKATLLFKMHVNKMAGNNGRAAAIRELSLQIDNVAVQRVFWVLSIWDSLSTEQKIAYYEQVVKYTADMHQVEQTALDKINELINQPNFDKKNIPAFITLALTTHKKLLEMTGGLNTMITWLESNKPEELKNTKQHKPLAHNQLLDKKLHEKRHALIAKL